jgi:hypothetical protein
MVDGKLFSVPIYPKRSMKSGPLRPQHADTPSRPNADTHLSFRRSPTSPVFRNSGGFQIRELSAMLPDSNQSFVGQAGAAGVLPHYSPLACFDELHQIIYLGGSCQPVPSQLFQSLLGI